MRLTVKQLKSLSVSTQSGVLLGHIHDIVVDSSGQLVVQYMVKSSLIGGVEYLVSRDQIVRFEEKRIIVDDSFSAERHKEERKKSMRVSPKPVAMREQS